MGIKITLKSDHYSGLFQDIRNRLIEEIEKQAERIILSPDHNYEITTQIPYNNEPGSPEIFQQHIYAVNKQGAVIGDIFLSETIEYKNLPNDVLLLLLRSLEFTL